MQGTGPERGAIIGNLQKIWPRQALGVDVWLTSTRALWVLEQELQSELNEPRRVQLAVHNSEARVIRGAAGGVWRAKLHTIEGVEELGPELQSELILRSEVRCLEYRDVPVVDSLPAQRRIHAPFVAEAPIGGRREAAWIEPRDSARKRRMGYGLVASLNVIRTQNTDSQVR